MFALCECLMPALFSLIFVVLAYSGFYWTVINSQLNGDKPVLIF